MSAYPVQEFVSKHFPWTVIFYARKQFGFEWSWLIREWIKSKPGKQSVIRGNNLSKVDDFFDRLIERDIEENRVQYACVNGCCVVIWHTKKNYSTGGFGPTGCSCEDLDDPRDLERGPLNAEA